MLIILGGKATQLTELFHTLPKRYIARAVFGLSTDTLDSTGKEVQTTAIIPSEQQVIASLQFFKGTIQQQIPMYSARHHNGERLYDIAHRGETIETKKNNVAIYDIKYLSYAVKENKNANNNNKTQAIAWFDIECSTGTYIRSLIADIAQKCGSLAYTDMLSRISIGSLHLKNAWDNAFNIPKCSLFTDSWYSVEPVYEKIKNGISFTLSTIELLYGKVVLYKNKFLLFGNKNGYLVSCISFDVTGKGSYVFNFPDITHC